MQEKIERLEKQLRESNLRLDDLEACKVELSGQISELNLTISKFGTKIENLAGMLEVWQNGVGFVKTTKYIGLALVFLTAVGGALAGILAYLKS